MSNGMGNMSCHDGAVELRMKEIWNAFPDLTETDEYMLFAWACRACLTETDLIRVDGRILRISTARFNELVKEAIDKGENPPSYLTNRIKQELNVDKIRWKEQARRAQKKLGYEADLLQKCKAKPSGNAERQRRNFVHRTAFETITSLRKEGEDDALIKQELARKGLTPTEIAEVFE